MKNSSKIIDIIGVPSDFGANISGSLMGPAALRTAGIHEKLKQIGRITHESGDIEVSNRYQLAIEHSENKYLKIVSEICKKLKKSTLETFEEKRIPLVLGGDHSIAIGSLAATCQFNDNKRIGLFWVDTHADINTPETSPSGNIHGMPISVLLGKGYSELTQLFQNQSVISPENIVLLGLRDIDHDEKSILKKSGITFYTMRDVDEKGIRKIMKEVLKHQFKEIDGLHLSFDLDVMNPAQIPGVSTPVAGGLTLREAHLLLEMLFESQLVISADFVELNPFKDIQGQSATMTVELICSLFGKTII